MSKKEEKKTINWCPVCESRDTIVQDYIPQKAYRHMVMLNGSHCSNCGVKFAFNKEVE